MSPETFSAPTLYGLSCRFDGCNPASPPSVRDHVGLGPSSRIPVRLAWLAVIHVVS